MIPNDPTGDEERLRQRLLDFYSELKAKLKPYRDARQHLDRFLSADFNVFKWIEPDEDRLSDIIADLLDENGSHGQQHRFLDAFLQVIGRPDLKDKKPLEVHREFPITHGRLDILVKFENFVIAIENKPWPWSKEGNEQIGKYSDYLNNEYKGRFCLIFLTPEGDKPTSIEENKCSELIQNHKLLLLSYRPNILDWLGECAQLCESDKFRWFLRDFMDHLNGGQTMASQKEKEIILAHALEEKNLETALAINSTFNGDLNEEIIRGFLNKLEEFVLLQRNLDASEKWCVNNDDLRQHPLKQRKRFSFGKESWEDHHGVILEPASNNACDFAMGVWKKNDPKPIFNEEDRLREKLTDLTADFPIIGMEPSEWNNEWWVWHSCLTKAPYQHWNTKEALFKLQYDEDTVRDLGLAFVKIIRVIDQHVQEFS